MKAVIYARYSCDSQREESIEGQIRECTEYANRNGMTILRSYIDRALSARTADRPEFQNMIRDSEKGLFDIVLVWKIDRFSRDRYDSAHYKHLLKKNGVKAVSAKENISDGPEGIILESMLEGYAEYYSAELSEKNHRGQRENALEGRNNGGGIPLGYLLDSDQKLVIDPVTAPLVEEINQFKYGDTDSIEYQKRIIDTFVNAIFLFDDKIVITYNFKGGTETITMKDIEAAYGSDMTLMSPPRVLKKDPPGLFLIPHRRL